MTSLCLCVFVAAIDVTIISTALPTIASTFPSPSSYAWIGSSYVLGNCASTPSWGHISDLFGRKPVLLTAIAIFAVGSLMCALAKDGSGLGVFLGGRVVQGVGASGLLTLVNITISDLFSLRDRSLYFGLTSVVWAFASGIGPVLGGVFTQQLSWRWCFWINLPISGIVFLLLIFTMPKEKQDAPILRGLLAIDWSGSILIIGATLMLLLGLNFGGQTFSWSSATVINLIIFGVFTYFLFSLNEWKFVKHPVIPLRLFRSLSSVASFTVCFFHGYVLIGIAYYLPLYFQAVLSAGPLLSGVYLLPFILTETCSAALTGIYIQRTGKYISAVYLGILLTVLGTGLLINLDTSANWPKIAIYQMIVGAGIGMNFEGPLLALQANVDEQDVATATATMGFTRILSAAISAIIGGVVFQNEMAKERPNFTGLGGEFTEQLAGGEATAHVEMIRKLPIEQQAMVRDAFQRSLRSVWIMYAAFAAGCLVSGLFIAVHPLSKDVPTRLGVREDAIDSSEGTAVEDPEGGNAHERTAEDVRPADNRT
ncbi:major facilitator superfamily domain-containing protein [Bisporella sp. PMI_857]|nr:major facilitator superfamily domain-containing protein [Bisporella sp. PMI_857]